MNRYVKLGLCLFALASVPLIMAPRNGAGSYSLPAGNPVVSGTTISSTVHNNTMSDIATALTASIAKDGQTTPTANLPMGSFRHTSVGDASARTHYGVVNQIQDGDYNIVGSVAGTNTVTGNLTPSITAYSVGMKVVLIPANANTGATTLNLNGVGALDVQKYTSAGQVAVAANDLRAGIPALLLLDTGGDDWILANPYSGALGDVTIGTLTVSTSLSTPAITLAGNSLAGANPSASVGLTAVNGTATTYMRSDGAPALSQSIAPTWSSAHIFSSAFTSGVGAVNLNSSLPGLTMRETDGAANNQRYDWIVSGEQLLMRILSDDAATQVNWMTVDRTATAVDQVAFPSESANRAFAVGTPNTNAAATLAQVRSTGGGGRGGLLAASASTSGIVPLVVQNEATSGDNVFIEFRTEANSGTVRGLIDFDRAGVVTRYLTTSDMRLKMNFRVAPSARGVIDCILIESFDWRETKTHVDHGLVAQRLNKCAPYAVSKGKVWQVAKAELVPVMLKYIQEQDARIAHLERQNAQFSRLEARLAALEGQRVARAH